MGWVWCAGVVSSDDGSIIVKEEKGVELGVEIFVGRAHRGSKLMSPIDDLTSSTAAFMVRPWEAETAPVQTVRFSERIDLGDDHFRRFWSSQKTPVPISLLYLLVS